jgi:CRP/FNR family transcriptional regulator
MSVPAGRTFITEGEPAEHFFNVIAGTTKVIKLLPDGRQQITGFASTGTFLGLAISSRYAFSAEALDATQVCRFSRIRMRRLIAEFPVMERHLLALASNELVAAQEQMLLLGRKTARERVASFLLAREACASGCAKSVAGIHIVLPMTRNDIADYLGLTLETVSRTMSKLRTEHLIEMPAPTEIVLRNRTGLEELASGTAGGRPHAADESRDFRRARSHRAEREADPRPRPAGCGAEDHHHHDLRHRRAYPEG